MDTEARSWAIDRPVGRSPFALPSGLRGRLAGWIMSRTTEQDGIPDLVAVRPGDRVLEVGYGPGQLIRLLASRTEARSIHGVDPSPEMRAAATRRNRAAVAAGRVTLAIGTADRTGLLDDSVDRVVAVNNVAIWPDLEAGLREFRRVLVPGGAAVVAWHGGTAPGRIAAALRLPADRLERIERVLGALFAEVTRHQLKSLDVFVAR
jgi:ubiquinone/menaquinone biosynthesis C-methylase UbiE